MKLTQWGIILTLKNLGSFLASYTIAQIKTDPTTFAYAFLIYAFINVPTDLLIANHMSAAANKKVEKKP